MGNYRNRNTDGKNLLSQILIKQKGMSKTQVVEDRINEEAFERGIEYLSCKRHVISYRSIPLRGEEADFKSYSLKI